MNEMEDDPDCKQYLLLQEQLEFWRLRIKDETLTKEEKERAEKKCIEIMEKAVGALERFNQRWDRIDGPLPQLDEDELREVQRKLSNIGIEASLEEIDDVLKEDQDPL